MKKHLAFFNLLFAIQFTSGAQIPMEEDSLLLALKTSREDTAKIDILNKLSVKFQENNPEKAIAFGKQALAFSERIGFKKGMGNAYNSLAIVMRIKGDYLESIKFSESALKFYKETGNKGGIGNSYSNIGIVNKNQGNYLEALKNQKAALLFFEEIGDKIRIGKTYNNIGVIYKNQGNYSGALKYYLEGLNISKQMKDYEGTANCLSNIGIIYRLKGNYSESLKNYFNSLKLSEEIGYKIGVSIALNNIGNLFEETGNFQEALKYQLFSKKISEEIGNKKSIANSLNSIGVVYVGLGNYTSALKHYKAAMKILEEIGDKSGIARLYYNIGEINNTTGDFEYALTNLFLALKMQMELDDKTAISLTYNSIGNIYLNLKKYKNASLYLNKALVLSMEISNLKIIAESYGYLTKLDSVQGDFKAAFGNYKLFVLNHESLLNKENIRKITQQQMQFDFDKNESKVKAAQEKKDALANAEIKRQTLIRNSTLGGVSIAGVFSFFLVYSFNRRRKTAFEKQVSEVEMKALRSQMNPHFIFNSLNSVKKYIMENAKIDAAEYLSKFATLMRLILDNSRKQEVTLDKDLSALELYMELESLRFQNKFQFSIEVDPEIDREDTMIAPLLLQPFVENSIIHGISSKENGMIKVKVNKVDNMIKCTVEDNGIGRDQSVQVETGEKKKRESLGMKITQERLKIINHLKKVKTAVNIFDLKDENNMPGGLRIELILPFETAF